MSPQELLLDPKRQELLHRIRASSAMDPSRFDSICLSLLNNLINHCQRLPETTNSYYSLPGGLLDFAINRTDAALSLFSQFVVREDGAGLSEEQQLWLYALLSAGFLQGVGKLQIDYRVDLFDIEGAPIKPWSPLIESMASVGAYYQYQFQPEGDVDFRRRLNLLMARLLMPLSGFAWIISNSEVLAIWLALLHEDMHSAGMLGAILTRANAIAIQRYFNGMSKGLGGRSGRQNRIITFVDSVPESMADKERLMGVEFIKWLTSQLESGAIMLNKAFLFTVPGGLLMSLEIFKRFVREHPEYSSWQTVNTAFLSLGIHALGPDGTPLSRFEQVKTQQMHSGIVISEYAAVLPDQVQIYNLNTGEVSPISAVELINSGTTSHHFLNRQEQGVPQRPLSQLSAAGQWQPVETKQPSYSQSPRG